MWYVRFHNKQLNSILTNHCISLNLPIENASISYQGKELPVLTVTVDTLQHVANSEDFRRADLEIYRDRNGGIDKITRQAFLNMTDSERRKHETARKKPNPGLIGDLKSRGLITTADQVPILRQ